MTDQALLATVGLAVVVIGFFIWGVWVTLTIGPGPVVTHD